MLGVVDAAEAVDDRRVAATVQARLGAGPRAEREQRDAVRPADDRVAAVRGRCRMQSPGPIAHAVPSIHKKPVPSSTQKISSDVAVGVDRRRLEARRATSIRCTPTATLRAAAPRLRQRPRTGGIVGLADPCLVPVGDAVHSVRRLWEGMLRTRAE